MEPAGHPRWAPTRIPCWMANSGCAHCAEVLQTTRAIESRRGNRGSDADVGLLTAVPATSRGKNVWRPLKRFPELEDFETASRVVRSGAPARSTTSVDRARRFPSRVADNPRSSVDSRDVGTRARAQTAPREPGFSKTLRTIRAALAPTAIPRHFDSWPRVSAHAAPCTTPPARTAVTTQAPVESASAAVNAPTAWEGARASVNSGFPAASGRGCRCSWDVVTQRHFRKELP